ncbi:MAG: hypothetical protein Q7T26_12070 [Dehalococcoidia bacterium]|nr:hypothetical protein [Dehalococcoidia bacterium]
MTGDPAFTPTAPMSYEFPVPGGRVDGPPLSIRVAGERAADPRRYL